MSVTNELAQIEAKLATQQRLEAQAQVAREASAEKAKAAVTALEQEFGVTSVAEAVKLHGELEAALAEDLQKIGTLLDD